MVGSVLESTGCRSSAFEDDLTQLPSLRVSRLESADSVLFGARSEVLCDCVLWREMTASEDEWSGALLSA